MKKIITLAGLCLAVSVEAQVLLDDGFESYYTVGGTTTDAGVTLKLNGNPDFELTQVGAYSFPNELLDGSDYVVQLISAPPDRACMLENASGTVSAANVDDVNVTCTDPVTVYDVKQGFSSGFVGIDNLQIVSCMDQFGFTAQTLPGDVDYAGDNFSGIFIFDSTVDCANPGQSPNVGDRVNLLGVATDFFGQILMIDTDFEVLSSGNPPPDPVMTTTAAIGTMNAPPLEGVLVQITNATVTNIDVPAGPGDSDPTNEFEVDGALKVDDRLYLTTPFPQVSDVFPVMRGIVTYRNNSSKLLPRYSSDAFIGDPLADHLVINEVDYDQEGTDLMEFVEIFNPTTQTISLANMSLYLVNGGNSQEYDRVDLDSLGELLSGQYIVVGSEALLDTVYNDTLEIAFEDEVTNIQNGPDGVLLINRQTEVVSDALSYEGSITAQITDLGNLMVPLVEGTATSEADSNNGLFALARIPNGTDTDNAEFDWRTVAHISPGAANKEVSNDPSGLVLNEVDYNQPGDDTEEYLEILNTSGVAISFQDVDLHFVNGINSMPYDSYVLAEYFDFIEPGQYLVIRSPFVSVPGGVLDIQFTETMGNIQNGSSDGILLFNNRTLTAIDALSYAGSLTDANINGTIINLVEGNVLVATDSGSIEGSLIRFPNGVDTDDADSDWEFSASITPGEENEQD